jgi:hypothetical protein
MHFVMWFDASGNLESNPRFTDAAGTGDCQQSAIREQSE